VEETEAARQRFSPESIDLVVASIHLTAGPEAREGYALYQRRRAWHAGLPFPLVSGDPSTFLDGIQVALSQRERVILRGSGTFAVPSRAGRKGRQPHTGQELTIPAHKSPTFRAGKRWRKGWSSQGSGTVSQRKGGLQASAPCPLLLPA
jgi:nucleoid DNA-binding protein